MCGVFAEFECALIHEKVMTGLERARTQGKTSRRLLTAKVVEKYFVINAVRVRASKKIARKLGIGVNTVQRMYMNKCLSLMTTYFMNSRHIFFSSAKGKCLPVVQRAGPVIGQIMQSIVSMDIIMDERH